MSSEYSIHLGDKPIKGRVYDLGEQSGIMVTVDLEALGNADAGVRLFVDRDRLLEASLLFSKIAQDLVALLPEPEADWPTHQHGPDDMEASQHGPNSHTHGVAGHVDTIMGEPFAGTDAPEHLIPIDEAAEHVEPPHRYG